MSTQSPRRNGRNQGLKMKNMLQIGVFLGVGIWLLYHLQQQQQHLERISDEEVVKFPDLGRKDLKSSVRTDDSESGGEENEMEDHSDEELNSNDEQKQEGSEITNLGVETNEANSEIRQGDDDMVIKENEDGDQKNDVQKMEEMVSIQILGAEESKPEMELTDKKMEENLSNGTTAVENKNQGEIKSDEGKHMDQAKNSTEDSGLFGGDKDQQNKTDVNSTTSSIPSKNAASNRTIFSEESKSSSELSGLDASDKGDQPQIDTNSLDKSSSQEKEQKTGAAKNDSETSKPESDIENARMEIETLPKSRNNSNQETNAK